MPPTLPRVRILVVEDQPPLVASLFAYFEPRGCVLDAAPDGVTGLGLAVSRAYDVMLLDWMLPRLDGPGVLRRLRASDARELPVIMLTARGEVPDKVAGFRAGADDYLAKPFALAELEVRIEAVVARTRGAHRQDALVVGDLRYDLRTLDVVRAGRTLRLFPAGRRLLEVLMRASPAVVPRAELEYALWADDPPDGNALRSHVHELRREVDPPGAAPLIHTLPRVGYRIAAVDAGRAGPSPA